MKVFAVLALVGLSGWVQAGCGGCGKTAGTDAGGMTDGHTADGGAIAGADGATVAGDTTGGAAAGDVAGDAAAGDAAAGDAAAQGEAERRRKIIEALANLEVPGLKRVRGEARGESATLLFDSLTPNDRGQTAAIEATIGFCDGCPAVTKQEVEGRKDAQLAQYGELHAKNPGLVFKIEDIELMPMRQGVSTFVRSFVDDGTTRAAILAMEVVWVDSGVSARFQAYPRSGFPTSAAEQEKSITQAELADLVRSVFKAAAAVIWPPQ